jgi:hypothetical protein
MAVHIVDILQQWSENNAFFIWLRESPSVFAYPMVFFVHTLGLIFTAGASVVIDARLLGGSRQLPVAPLARYFTAIWIGITLTVLSGAVMLGSDIQTKVQNRVFLPKMLCVVVAIAVTAVLRSRIASTRPEALVSPLVRVLAATSLLCWLGAIALGKLAAYF